MHQNEQASKVFYRPIEAAIRWAGLLRYEHVVLAAISSSRHLPQSLDCPRWDEVRLYTDRIYDGILNGELPFGKNGITINDTKLIDSPELTVRHVDLKRWMHEHYPGQRPGFLFSRSERIAHPFITVETGQAMLVERMALKSALQQCKRQLLELQERHDALLKQSTAIPACAQCPISDRAEATYLNIIGGMLDLMLGQSPSGTPYSCFKTQEAVVSTLIAHHGGVMGITERTLNGKFAIARRRLHSAAN
ncbi:MULTISPECIES: hypothetical protein [Pseudomonadota]|uniref:Receptor protein-tyrosine kinase n=1 Tax=Azoarcus taiwanensis TaxID=666964 RepID=A0A972FE85_9RHOO|nr:MULTISPECIES: hypothetical protein [Pseudomonadota]EDT3379542.1 hypothetical protein [Salmonella enterica subsp. enterica serovar Mbandaka]EDU8579548.1 hypothetical protein [Salmonella enterica subsp. enterica serovar Mbandaka]EDV5271909.1 hypothetical protein [Salmonella enterica subsp. enterica serovar Mbandaka]MDM7357374.1 hypothetical protein [Klebsiella pneumoniae]MDV2646452.1 hypothetical protein [Pseudomonas aeruginosa]